MRWREDLLALEERSFAMPLLNRAVECSALPGDHLGRLDPEEFRGNLTDRTLGGVQSVSRASGNLFRPRSRPVIMNSDLPEFQVRGSSPRTIAYFHLEMPSGSSRLPGSRARFPGCFWV